MLDPSSYQQVLPLKHKKLSVGIIGASGKIGSRVLEDLWRNPDKYSELRVVAINTVPDVNRGRYMDFATAYPELLFNHSSQTRMETVISDDFATLKGSHVVFMGFEVQWCRVTTPHY